jgi:hypothetical protein
MNDWVIISHLNPSSDSSSSPTVNPLEHGNRSPLTIRTLLRRNSPLLVFKIKEEMGPTLPII